MSIASDLKDSVTAWQTKVYDVLTETEGWGAFQQAVLPDNLWILKDFLETELEKLAPPYIDPGSITQQDWEHQREKAIKLLQLCVARLTELDHIKPQY